MGGRGAYICLSAEPGVPSAECLQRAIGRGGIARTLRSAVTLDAKLVESVGP